MRKLIIIGLIIIGSATSANAQVDRYVLSGGEMIFSLSEQNTGQDNVLRWSPVFNFQSWQVFDFGVPAIFYGLGIRNVGFIIEDEVNDVVEKTKYRTYNLGVPVGMIFQVTDKTAIYGGYEFEIPFHYKEKRFIDGDKKEKITNWFADQTPNYTQSVFAGFQFKGGLNLKFKYYLDNFFDTSFEEDGAVPFDGYEVNVFYVALTFNVLKGKEIVINDAFE